MTARVDFYSLERDSSGDRFILCCRLVERIRARSLRVLIYCPDEDEARHLNRLLWTFREESFIPHGLVGEVDPILTPVLISANGEPSSETQVLINLAPEIAPFFARFERLCELIDHDPRLRAAGRERFRQYRAQGYALEHHGIRL